MILAAEAKNHDVDSRHWAPATMTLAISEPANGYGDDIDHNYDYMVMNMLMTMITMVTTMVRHPSGISTQL